MFLGVFPFMTELKTEEINFFVNAYLPSGGYGINLLL